MMPNLAGSLMKIVKPGQKTGPSGGPSANLTPKAIGPSLLGGFNMNKGPETSVFKVVPDRKMTFFDIQGPSQRKIIPTALNSLNNEEATSKNLHNRLMPTDDGFWQKTFSELFIQEVQREENNDPMKTKIKISEISQYLLDLEESGSYYPTLCGKILGMFGQFQVPLKQFIELQRFKKSVIKLTDSDHIDYRVLTTCLIRYDVAIDEIYTVCNSASSGMSALVLMISDHQNQQKSWTNLKFFKEYKNQLQ